MIAQLYFQFTLMGKYFNPIYPFGFQKKTSKRLVVQNAKYLQFVNLDSPKWFPTTRLSLHLANTMPKVQQFHSKVKV